MYQRIMVPLDGSELAECVLPHVESIAKGCGVKSVIFVGVVEPIQFTGGGADAAGYFLKDEDLRQMEVSRQSAVEDYLQQTMSRLNYDGVNLQSEVIRGKAAESLAEYAEKNEIDLIVMATHGRSGISRWVVGNVADRIIRSACVPVLLVRAPGCIPGI